MKRMRRLPASIPRTSVQTCGPLPIESMAGAEAGKRVDVLIGRNGMRRDVCEPGLGHAIALAFAQQGASVLLAARSRANLEAFKDEIAAGGGWAVVQPTDVTDIEQLSSVTDA